MTEHEPLQQALAQYEQEALPQYEQEALPQRLAAWLESGPVVPEPAWLGLELLGARASGGYFGISKTVAQGDGSWLVNIVAGSPDTLSFKANLEHNRMAAKVMAETGVPVSDFYALLADKLALARGGKDKFYWNAPAYKILGDKCVEEVLKSLPAAK